MKQPDHDVYSALPFYWSNQTKFRERAHWKMLNEPSRLCGWPRLGTDVTRIHHRVPGELLWLEKKIRSRRRLVPFGLDGCTLRNRASRRPRLTMHQVDPVCMSGVRGQRATGSSDKLGRQVLIKNSRATAEEFKSTANSHGDSKYIVNVPCQCLRCLWWLINFISYAREKAATRISRLINAKVN